MIPAGHRFDFHARTQRLADEGWGPLERAVARWVLAHGGDARLAEIAAHTGLADARGDSALRIDDAGLRDRLAAMPMVGDGASQGTPFVLDGDLFYLRRNFAHEIAVAEMLRARLAANDAVAGADLNGLFDAAGGDAQSSQVEAVRKALGRRLFVLTGGPGTGKTTTVLRLLMAASRRHFAREGDWPRIVLAAPTGKAAQRLGESLRRAEADDFPAGWQAALEQVKSGRPDTLHRMLGSRGIRGGFTRGADMLLDADIGVVDEASMLDLALLRALLEALPPQASLLLGGDADQLDSVGTGSVLQDIVAALEGDPAHLHRLQHAYRADAALRPLNETVRAGDAEAFLASLDEAGESAGRQSVRDVAALGDRVDAWCDGLLDDYRRHGIAHMVDANDSERIAEWLAMAEGRQLLCALREGPFGAVGLNAAIEARLAPALGDDIATSLANGSRWYPGRRILVTRNDPGIGLFNGDVGLCLRDRDGLRVWFAGEGSIPRAFAIAALPPYQPAFALTVHKAQGSEYDEVVVVPPPRIDHPLLSRQWFYTAISRARRCLHLWTDAASLTRAIERPARRSSGLVRRIRSG